MLNTNVICASHNAFALHTCSLRPNETKNVLFNLLAKGEEEKRDFWVWEGASPVVGRRLQDAEKMLVVRP